MIKSLKNGFMQPEEVQALCDGLKYKNNPFMAIRQLHGLPTEETK